MPRAVANWQEKKIRLVHFESDTDGFPWSFFFLTGSTLLQIFSFFPTDLEEVTVGDVSEHHRCLKSDINALIFQVI